MRLALALTLVPAGRVRRPGGVEVRVNGDRVDILAINAPLGRRPGRPVPPDQGQARLRRPAPPRQLLSVDIKDRTPAEALLALLEGQGLAYAVALDPTGTRVQTLLLSAASTAPAGPGAPRVVPSPPERPIPVRESVVEEPLEDGTMEPDVELPPDTGRPNMLPPRQCRQGGPARARRGRLPAGRRGLSDLGLRAEGARPRGPAAAEAAEGRFHAAAVQSLAPSRPYLVRSPWTWSAFPSEWRLGHGEATPSLGLAGPPRTPNRAGPDDPGAGLPGRRPQRGRRGGGLPPPSLQHLVECLGLAGGATFLLEPDGSFKRGGRVALARRGPGGGPGAGALDGRRRAAPRLRAPGGRLDRRRAPGHQRRLGVLTLHDPAGAAPAPATDLLEALGKQIGAGLENARLYAELRASSRPRGVAAPHHGDARLGPRPQDRASPPSPASSRRCRPSTGWPAASSTTRATTSRSSGTPRAPPGAWAACCRWWAAGRARWCSTTRRCCSATCCTTTASSRTCGCSRRASAPT